MLNNQQTNKMNNIHVTSNFTKLLCTSRYQTETQSQIINHLMPNDPYSGCTALLTSKYCILYIYSTNIGTEYFKHGIYSPFFLFKIQFVS